MLASEEAVSNLRVNVPSRELPKALVADSGAWAKSHVLSGVTGQVWCGAFPHGTLSANARAVTSSESCRVVTLKSRKVREPSGGMICEGHVQDGQLGDVLDPSGVRGAARADTSRRNRRDPPAHPTDGRSSLIKRERVAEVERSAKGVGGGRSTDDREESTTSRREGPLLESTSQEVSVRAWPKGPTPRSERDVAVHSIANARQLRTGVTRWRQARKRASPSRKTLGKPWAGNLPARFDWGVLKSVSAQPDFAFEIGG